MVERMLLARPGSVVATGQLPQLVVRDVDRGELQYISTVNGFLTDSPVLCSLLGRQSNHRGRARKEGGGESSHSALERQKERVAPLDGREGKSDDMDGMDGMAYDMMMGNYNRVALFVKEE